MPKRRKSKWEQMEENVKKSLKLSMKGSWFCNKNKEELNESASFRKIQPPNELNTDDSEGNIIINIDILRRQLHGIATCSKCLIGKLTIHPLPTKRIGMCTMSQFSCDNIECNFMNEFASSKICKNSKTFEVNRAMVLGMRSIGRGRNGGSKLLAHSLPQPVATTPYSEHTKILTNEAKGVLDEELKNAAKRIHDLKKGENDHSDDEIVSCGMTVHGSWLNRGVSSRHGFVSVISIDTGEVLDYHYMCSVCPECSTWEDKSSVEYLDWFIGHEPYCKLNHDGSSQSMETEGASILFRRSVQKHKIMYNPFIGDGDSKAFHRICREKPYGPEIDIVKEKCIGHIQKRTGTRLCNIINRYKGQILSDGKELSGPGRLTLAMVDSFQVWYGQAIRQNKGNVDKMSTETMAILNIILKNPITAFVHWVKKVGASFKWTKPQEGIHMNPLVILLLQQLSK